MDKRRAFTLVELLIVIIIIAVLAAIAIPKFTNSRASSKETALKGNLRIIREALDRHVADTGKYPRALTALYQNDAPPSGICYFPNGTATTYGTNSGFKGPYLSKDGSVDASEEPNDAVTGSELGSRGAQPVDPVSGQVLVFRFSSGRWSVVSSASGNDSKGVPYRSY